MYDMLDLVGMYCRGFICFMLYFILFLKLVILRVLVELLIGRVNIRYFCRLIYTKE